MNILKVILVSCSIIALFSIQGCTPAHMVKVSDDPMIDNSKVLIYRESAFNASGMPMIFGENESDYTQLWNDDYTEIKVDNANHIFFVRSNQADIPYALPLDMEDGKNRCLKGYANPKNLAKALFFPSYYWGNTFLLEEVECPSDTELSNLDRI